MTLAGLPQRLKAQQAGERDSSAVKWTLILKHGLIGLSTAQSSPHVLVSPPVGPLQHTLELCNLLMQPLHIDAVSHSLNPTSAAEGYLLH